LRAALGRRGNAASGVPSTLQRAAGIGERQRFHQVGICARQLEGDAAAARVPDQVHRPDIHRGDELGEFVDVRFQLNSPCTDASSPGQ
jgi:hypothetical protein